MTGRRVGPTGIVFVVLSMLAGPANAWDANGHKTVAALAERLIASTKAADQVRAILGNTSLEDAAVWADCAKGVQATGTPPVFKYAAEGQYGECKPFETPQGEAEMVDFVKRNYDTCKPKPGEEVCHKQYHYSDISIEHDHYAGTFVGARPDDVEMAIAATVDVLEGNAAPAPFNIKSKREALLLLVHYVGDIHQPLHVGAVYLDSQGRAVDPEIGTFDPATDTRGGNSILISFLGQKLHSAWDYIPPDMQADKVTEPWVTKAKKIPVTGGAPATWSLSWATDTQKQAQKALQGIKCGPKTGSAWFIHTRPTSDASMNAIKTAQLTKGGARLAALLGALWPGPAQPGARPAADMQRVIAMGEPADSNEPHTHGTGSPNSDSDGPATSEGKDRGSSLGAQPAGPPSTSSPDHRRESGSTVADSPNAAAQPISSHDHDDSSSDDLTHRRGDTPNGRPIFDLRRIDAGPRARSDLFPSVSRFVPTIGFVVGFVVCLVLALLIPYPSPHQQIVLRTLLSICGAGLGVVLPGDLHLGGTISGLRIEAAGGIGLCLVFYLITPKIIAPGQRGRGGRR